MKPKEVLCLSPGTRHGKAAMAVSWIKTLCWAWLSVLGEPGGGSKPVPVEELSQAAQMSP